MALAMCSLNVTQRFYLDNVCVYAQESRTQNDTVNCHERQTEFYVEAGTILR